MKRPAAPRRRDGKVKAEGAWSATKWLLLRLAGVYLAFNLSLNVFLSVSQPLRPLRLITLGRIDERLDAAGLLLRHYVPVHACERDLSRTELEEVATGAAVLHGLEPALLLAIADAESGFVPHAVSPVGAVGVAQLMPSTARWIHVEDPFDPRDNLDGSARYLKSLMGSFKGDITRVVAAYNAGPGAVRRFRGVPPYGETRAYVRRVTERLAHYRSVALATADPGTR